MESLNLKPLATNETVVMTRHYPKLARKVLERDSKIAKKIIQAWDNEHDEEKLLSIFIKEKKNLSDERYWELLRIVWIITGGLVNVDLFRSLMRSKRPNRYYFSTPEETKKLRELQDVFIVFRACNSNDDDGISWTTSRTYAEQYKDLFNKEMILSRWVSKDEVFAYIDRNLESEIIIL